MPSTNTPDQNTIPPTHKDFRWIHAPGKNERFADFIELTRDVTAGVVSSLQIIYSSNLVREMNQDCDPGHESAPAIGTTDAANLLRLSLAASTMLCDLAQDRIGSLNKWWDE